ncbi:PK beta-barrel-protein domain-containing protein-like protein [Aspergillus avenaceus]|uniref:PK beta-barrel-protein domain-containing protein-like protein n=1 Tax=Aspergillus avenaceus TaxID=36643 RepID=A0A5N6TKJ7_ASPAV|nr:PK beta-barrel-protein domain-containing protein-like protein [Aspergillus avenaceus]
MPRIHSLSCSPTHNFTKFPIQEITLLSNHGIQGDCHAGTTVQHRSRLYIHPSPPNLRQVHLIPIETLRVISDTLDTNNQRHQILEPGALGQNITTEGVDLLHLRTGVELRFVDETGAQSEVVLEVTGLRNPCAQIDRFMPGLKEKFLVRNEERKIVGRLAGVMAVVKTGGVLRVGMGITINQGYISFEITRI